MFKQTLKIISILACLPIFSASPVMADYVLEDERAAAVEVPAENVYILFSVENFYRSVRGEKTRISELYRMQAFYTCINPLPEEWLNRYQRKHPSAISLELLNSTGDYACKTHSVNLTLNGNEDAYNHNFGCNTHLRKSTEGLWVNSCGYSKVLRNQTQDEPGLYQHQGLIYTPKGEKLYISPGTWQTSTHGNKNVDNTTQTTEKRDLDLAVIPSAPLNEITNMPESESLSVISQPNQNLNYYFLKRDSIIGFKSLLLLDQPYAPEYVAQDDWAGTRRQSASSGSQPSSVSGQNSSFDSDEGSSPWEEDINPSNPSVSDVVDEVSPADELQDANDTRREVQGEVNKTRNEVRQLLNIFR